MASRTQTPSPAVYRREGLFEWLRSALLRVDPTLSAEMIREHASLMNDLGLDSLRLEEIVTLIKSEVSDADLTPWYVLAARDGQDTVASLVDFLLDHEGLRT